jgi:LemA protein
LNAWKRLGIGAAAVVALGLVFYVLPYNLLNGANQDQQEAWGNVESTYQRRADLIPNLVKTVKGYAEHEEELFTEVAKLRGELGKITVEIGENGPTAEQIKSLTSMQGQMSSAFSRLIAVAESYPELKASENFLSLQAQLEGSENRINVARQRFNEAARRYNTMIGGFFCSWVAKSNDYEKVAYFEASEGAQTAPSVDFDN